MNVPVKSILDILITNFTQFKGKLMSECVVLMIKVWYLFSLVPYI
jgi:hypothetical protein